jgi:hypothetical protein
MKKLLMLVVVLVLGGAFAQGRLFGEVATSEVSLVPSFSLNATASMGAENVIGPLALRGNVGLQTGGGGTVFGIGADALFFLRNPGLNFYFGGGLGLVAAGNTSFAINGVAGLELPVTRDFNFLAELRPALVFVGNTSDFNLSLAFGPRLYFR